MNNKAKYFLIDDRTIMECEKGVTSLITFIPLKQTEESNLNESDKDYQKRYQEKIRSLLNRLATIDKKNGVFSFKTPEYGTVYKIVNLFEKDTVLQKGIIQTESASTRLESFGQERVITSDKDRFLETKEALKFESIANENLYDKVSFLVVKRMWNNKKIVKTLKNPGGYFELREGDISLYDRFSNYTKEKYEEDRDTIETLKKIHQPSYQEIEASFLDKGVDINSKNLSEWISRLSLSDNKTNFFDGDFINNNFFNESRSPKRVFSVESKKGGTALKVIKIEPSRVVLENPMVRGSRRIIKINEGEDYTIKKEIMQGEHTGNYLLQKKEIKNGYSISTTVEKIEVKEIDNKFVEQEEKNNIEAFFVNGLPSQYKPDLAINLKKGILEDIEPDAYVYQVELFRLATLDLEKKYKTEIKGLSMLSVLPSFGDLLYDRTAIFEKQTALAASLDQLKLLDFTNIRISFGFKKSQKNYNDTNTIELKAKAQNLDRIIPIKSTFSELMLPWAYSDYITSTFAQDSIGEVSVNELIKIIDLKDGQQYLSREKPSRLSDVEKVKKSAFFVKSKSTIQGVDIFKGPEKFNGLIMAPSGSGKSFFAVNMLDGFLGSSPHNIAWIIDKGGSFTRFAQIHEGVNKNVDLSDKDSSVNPFALSFKTLAINRLLEISNLLSKKETIVDKNTGKSKREFKYNFTPELKEELNIIVKLLQQYSDTTGNDSFRLVSTVDDRKLAKEVGNTGYDTFVLILDKNGDIVIDSEGNREIDATFTIEEPQATLEVLSSIVKSMLQPDKETTDKSPTGDYQQLTAKTVEVINGLFERKFLDKLNSLRFLLKYTEDENGVISEVEGQTLQVGLDEEKKSVKFRYESEQAKIMEENLYFTTSELKDEFSSVIKADKGTRDETTLPYLDALDFYIDMKQAGKLFNTKPPADLSKERLVNIDLGDSSSPRLAAVLPAAIFMNFFKIMVSPNTKLAKKILLIDEAHYIVGAESSSGLDSIEYLFRTARKHGAGVWLISQAITDFHRDDGPKKAKFNALKQNAGWRVILGGSHSIPSDDPKGEQPVFNLSEPAQEFVKKAKEGAEKFEMLLDMDGVKTITASLIVSGLDYWTSTTHKDEKTLLSVLGAVTTQKTAIRVMAELYSNPKKTFKEDYSDITVFQNTAPQVETHEVVEEVEKILVGKDLSQEKISIIRKNHRLVKAILLLMKEKNVTF